jgi:hypothetical protein
VRPPCYLASSFLQCVDQLVSAILCCSSLSPRSPCSHAKVGGSLHIILTFTNCQPRLGSALWRGPVTHQINYAAIVKVVQADWSPNHEILARQLSLTPPPNVPEPVCSNNFPSIVFYCPPVLLWLLYIHHQL